MTLLVAALVKMRRCTRRDQRRAPLEWRGVVPGSHDRAGERERPGNGERDPGREGGESMQDSE